MRFYLLFRASEVSYRFFDPKAGRSFLYLHTLTRFAGRTLIKGNSAEFETSLFESPRPRAAPHPNSAATLS